MTQAGQMTLRETVARAIEPSIVFDGFGNDRMEVARSVSQAALAALAVAGPSDAMVEAGARALMAESENADGDDWKLLLPIARACFTAMLAAAAEK